MRFPLLPLFLAAIMTSFQNPAASQEAKVFKAGAAASNITPRLGLSIAGNMADVLGTHIHDELQARCLVLDDGERRMALVLVDSCMVPRELFEEAKERLKADIGLDPDFVLMAATHSHSAPATAKVFRSNPDPEYAKFLVGRIVDGVKRAVNQLEPARIGWGFGAEPTQVFNRRWKMKPGTVPENPFGSTAEKVKMNPARGDENLVDPAGPTDPQVSVLSVQALDGRPICVLANYSLHYVGGVGGGHVSADYFGMFADDVEELLGAGYQDPPFVGMLSNGTSGDINNINFREQGQPQAPYEQMRKVADLVAKETHRVLGEIQYQDWVDLNAKTKVLELGVRKPSTEEIERAKAFLTKEADPRTFGLRTVYAQETVDLENYPETVQVPMQALRIGELGIAAIPCEVFVEIGLAIKAESALKPVFTIELANGYNGYLPTVEQHGNGGYETWRAKSSYLEVDAAPKVLSTVLELLAAVK